jgi:sugar phosphate permease
VVYLMIAALYFLSAVTMAFVRQPSRVNDQTGKPWAEVADAFVYVWQRPAVFGLIILSVLPFLFGMPLNTLLPAFNEDVLSGGPDDLGFLTSMMGAGAIVGSLVTASLGGMSRKGLWIVLTCVLWGAAVIGFGASYSLLLALVMIVAVGFLSSANMSLNRGLLQMKVDAHMRGRILSIDMMSHGLMPLGVMPISYIAEVHGVHAALIASGIAFIGLTLLAALALRSVRIVARGRDSA